MSAMAQANKNPLPAGRYELDLYTPTASTEHVRDGVPIFNKWREKNSERVRVLHAESWNTHPRQTRVMFEVRSKPGAFPFGTLGSPELVGNVGALPTIADVVGLMFNPLGLLEQVAASTAGQFIGNQAAALAQPELRELRDALIVVKANIALIRAMLEAVHNHTSPNPSDAIGAARQLIQNSIELLVAAIGKVVSVDFPRRAVSALIDELRAFEKAITEAPQKALDLLEQEAGILARDVGAPLAVSYGGLFAAGLAVYLMTTGKRNDSTDKMLLLGVAAVVLGGSTLFQNIQHPAPLPGFEKK